MAAGRAPHARALRPGAALRGAGKERARARDEGFGVDGSDDQEDTVIEVLEFPDGFFIPSSSDEGGDDIDSDGESDDDGDENGK